MGKDEFAKELIQILDDTINLMRQDVVTLRNEVMQQKIEISNNRMLIDAIKEDRILRGRILAVIIGGVIAGLTSVSVALIEIYKSHR